MPSGTIILLGAFAGLTIFLGLPVAFLRRMPQSLRMFMSMLATGVLLFLFFDVIEKASEPIGQALTAAREGYGSGVLIGQLGLFIGGLALGLLGLVYFNKYVIARAKTVKSAPATELSEAGSTEALSAALLTSVPVSDGGAAVATAPAPAKLAAGTVARELAPRTLSLIIATGIGLHNFSEGLAIGQSAAAGALSLATVLIIGFGLHNMTEGFGIAGPIAGQPISWKFIVLLGLIGGGPTFLGTLLGIQLHSVELFIFFLALAAGAIIFCVAELLGVAKRFKAQDIVMWGLLAGFLLGYLTDLIVSFSGA
jgi:zinc transporter, ZIP family